MKKLFILALVATIALTSCQKDEPTKASKNFTVTIENVTTAKTFPTSGIFNTPKGTSSEGVIMPGQSYEFSFQAGPGSKLSFATMFVQSNDLFYAPGADGIALFDNSKQPITGDITAQVSLWDAGTEVNEQPGTGNNQAPRQSGANVGTAENGTVRNITSVNDGFTYPVVNEVIKVSITNTNQTEFTVTIENVSASASISTPLSPGAWVIHSTSAPLFEANAADKQLGLESIAEDGNPATLKQYLDNNTGFVTPMAPGTWAIHNSSTKPFFSNNTTDNGVGLEALAEDGDPANLGAALASVAGVSQSGVFNTPSGASAPGVITPGGKYEFSFTATEGDYLSLATMFVQSNDLFYSFGDAGIALFENGTAISGDVTAQLSLWDAGTELNEYPGAGLNQAPRQTGANTGTQDNSNLIRIVNDAFTYPTTSATIKVTISSQ
ncbi:hypothetical protein BKI52_16510 [marine bacterium AO1-C]|nr:hypothetical protein BKI52_16510 [marine bacterium AO1-C]